MSCQRRPSSSSSSLNAMTTSASPSSSSTAASSPASASNAAPSSASSSSSCYFSSSSSALRIFSSSSSSSGTSPRPDEYQHQRRPNDHLQCSSPGRRAKFMASPCCLINLERADEISSSCPSLAALFSREENPSGGSSTRPSSASPTHQRKISNHQNRNRQKRNQHQKQRDRRTETDEDKSTTNSSSSKSAKSRRSSSASLWPSIVSQWRSRVGGAGLVLLLLQFLWVPPYLCFANYLERCLLPLRVYCYTAPDFLAVRVPLRDGPAACAAHFFANNAAHWAQRQTKRELSPMGSTCSLNGTLPVLLRPWHAIVDNESSIQRVIVIRSAPRAAEYRKYIRDSWKPAVEKLNGPVVFVAGRDGTELAAENGEHGDILQLDFEDSYRNLTLKMMGIYRFFTENTHVQQIVVINDDTIVNATALDELFRAQSSLIQPGQNRYMIGKVSRAYPRIVFPWLPWHVESELYPHKCYPPFVQGSSFVISRAAAAEVLRHVCDFAGYAIHLDDILMGLLTNCLGIPNIHRDGFDVGHSLESFTVFHYQFSRYSSLTLAEMFGRNVNKRTRLMMASLSDLRIHWNDQSKRMN
uniref:Hexosyltransferase n=1 Tax=Globodera rostochiensis TaxID=31243 RepID=A0A914GZ01_GLORO